jgi:hypothetical protein
MRGKQLLGILLLTLAIPTQQKEWGVRSSYTPSCNPYLRLYDGMPKYWFESREQAIYYVEKEGNIESTHLLLYRESEGNTEWLLAKIDIIERKYNETQISIKGLYEYFVQTETT